jgi:hypothetical protein
MKKMAPTSPATVDTHLVAIFEIVEQTLGL